MTRRKPPPRAPDLQDEQKLQRFLERAAPIVLDNPVLSTEQWGQLVSLAEELELGHEQFQQTIADWRERGILEETEVAVAKPPPLPGGLRRSEEPPTVKARVSETEFALSPPPPVGKRETLSAVSNRKTYAEEAAAIIARHRGMSSEAQVLLAKLARDHGLSDEQAHQALGSLLDPSKQPGAKTKSEPSPPVEAPPERRANRLPATIELPSSSTGVSAGRKQRWRVEGEDGPDPYVPKPPAETFREYLRHALAAQDKSEIAEQREQQLIQHGTGMLELSSVYARHLLSEVAAEKQIRLASQRKSGARDRRGAAETADPTVRLFLERAAPVIAQHRGINVQSRVLLNATARELGLSDQQVEQALIALHREPSTAEVIQRERLEAFGEYVRAALRRLPQGILTANVENRLATNGRLLHGIAEEVTRSTIHAEARELSIAIVSEAQAEQHVRGLVAELMGDAVGLRNDARDRIHVAGAQWGLSTNRIEAIIRDQVLTNRRRHRSERRLANAALVAASFAVLVVIGFLSWAVLENHLGRDDEKNLAGRREGLADPPVSPQVTAPVEVDSWWTGDLAANVARARLDFPELLRPLRELKNVDPEQRKAAYEELIRSLFDESASVEKRDALARIIASCGALEISDDNSASIAKQLLDAVPAPEAQLSQNAADFTRMFWAMRTVVASLAEARGKDDRAAKLARDVERAAGTTVDHRLPARELERHCLGALAERLYRWLISVATTQPNVVQALQTIVSAEARRYLDAAAASQLDADFLVAILTAAADRWGDYRDLLEKTIESPNALAVAKLVGLYERTTDRELQGYMSGPLLRRANALSETSAVTDIAGAVRRALGVSNEATGTERWAWLSRAANELLAKPASAEEPDESFLEEITTLAHLATLGCALAQGESGLPTFEDLRKKGPARIEIRDRSLGETSDAVGARRTVYSDIEGSSRKLSERGSVTRKDALERLARNSVRVPDILPRPAEQIAGYLLSSKSETDHKAAMGFVKALARWKHVRLALADGLEKSTLRREMLAALLSEVLGRTVESAQVESGRDSLRAELLNSVLAELNSNAGHSSIHFADYDSTRSALTRSYAQQSQLMDIAIPADAPADAPTAILRQLISAYAANVAARVTDPAAKRRFEGAPHDVAAAEYLATDDVQLTVQLERVWIQLLAAEIANRHPAQKDKVEAIVAELRSQDRKSTHIASQLRSGQAAQLRLWLLLNQPT